jgi:hypothetical protein
VQALRRIPIVLGLAVVLLLGGAMAYAAIPGSNGAINGCVNARTGVLRVVDAAKGQKCLNRPQALRETAISWNQRGPAGPATPGTGSSGGIASTDQLEGVPCDTKSARPGVTRVRYWGSSIALFCQRPGDPDIPLTPANSDADPVNPDLTVTPTTGTFTTRATPTAVTTTVEAVPPATSSIASTDVATTSNP